MADLAGVERAARRLRSRLAEIADCRRALDDEIARAVRAGAPVAHVAEAARLSRQTVYEAIATDAALTRMEREISIPVARQAALEAGLRAHPQRAGGGRAA